MNDPAAVLILAHMHRYFYGRIMLPRLQRFVSRMRLLGRFVAWRWWLIARHLIPAMTVTGAEGTMRAVFGCTVAVIVEVNGAEIVVRLREMSPGLVLSSWRAAQTVGVTVRTKSDGSVVVKVVSVVAAHGSWITPNKHSRTLQ